ncbi:hypothetical protein GMI70_02775 [Eggerthellaceae bacterium zg-893]|nr:hypothetical protein [Eggerthellaceae bacterium zg-893]
MLTKAKFKMYREDCGLTYADVASRCGATVDAVKKWEHPNYRQRPPESACSWLEETRAGMRRDAANIAERILADGGSARVSLPYWRNQIDYDGENRDGLPYTCANARTRLVARIVEGGGLDVEPEYPNADVKPPLDDSLMTSDEACDVLGISKSHLCNLARAGRIRKEDGKVYRSDVLRYDKDRRGRGRPRKSQD